MFQKFGKIKSFSFRGRCVANTARYGVFSGLDFPIFGLYSGFYTKAYPS